MDEPSEQFAQLLRTRAAQLPDLDARILAVAEGQRALSALQATIELARERGNLPPEVSDALGSVDLDQMHVDLDLALAPLRRCRSRFARPTVNIGVGGPARVGKSTLLQSISGLGDRQIPASDRGNPVTAVRSRIYHSTTAAEARLTMHTYETFRDEVLQPFHRRLGLPDPPTTLAGLRELHYPTSIDQLDHVPDPEDVKPALQFLLACRRSLDSFAPHLTGGEKVEPLDSLEAWVSYPADLDSTERPYLAVRQAVILATFPHAQVHSLVVVDLPGLGEVLPDAESRHLESLEDDTDFVLLLVRPNPGSAFWDRRSDQALQLIEKARGPIHEVRDFVAIVANTGGTKARHRDDLLASITQNVNEGEVDRTVRVLEADASDPANVFATVLAPVLAHLSERLPAMDDQFLQAAQAEFDVLRDKICNRLLALDAALQRWATYEPSSAEQFDALTDKLRDDLALGLQELADRYEVRASGEQIDEDFLEAIDTSYGGLIEWAEIGFGQGIDGWIEAAEKSRRRDRVAADFATKELNAIRNRIVSEYSALDLVCSRQVDALHSDVAEVLSASLGSLTGDGSGAAQLARLAELAASGHEPCDHLPSVLRQLLDLRLDYSVLILPRIRSDLDLLDPQHLADTGELITSDMEQLYKTLSQTAQRTAWETRKSLVVESVAPALALLVALERFEDALIRSGSSLRELRRLGRSYRDEIWPELSTGSSFDGRVHAIRRAVRELLDSLTLEVAE